MKTRGRRGERTRCLREDSLITLFVHGFAFASHVGRERHRPVRVEIDILAQRYNSFAVRQNLFDAQSYVVDLRRSTESHLSAWLDQTLPARRPDLFQKQELDRVIVRKSARRENPSVV